MLRWPDYFVDPPSDTTSGDVIHQWTFGDGFQTPKILQKRSLTRGDALFRVVGNPNLGPKMPDSHTPPGCSRP